LGLTRALDCVTFLEKYEGIIMHSDIESILLDQQQIATKVAELGCQISADFAGKEVTVVSILRGAIVFTADLMRQIDLPLELDFIGAQSYGDGMESSGLVNILKQLDGEVRGRHILLVDDILDTGYTLKAVSDILLKARPAALKIAVLLDKPVRRKVEINADYLGFAIDPVFVVGYGMDLAQQYRNLPYIGVLKENVLANHFGPRDGNI